MANTLEYGGYIGSLEYSPEDKVFYGKLEMIDDLVTFEADNASELEENFHTAVNEYIDTCRELGRSPQKTYKGIFNVRVNPELEEKVSGDRNRIVTKSSLLYLTCRQKK
ncbi:MAG: type II toxin-antitoxin system HicB family antitoxin [Campylobacterota bacterium]|nr:type II toxin-antitoxin system HicB family antitoxin [Campylobacterota bacterium]